MTMSDTVTLTYSKKNPFMGRLVERRRLTGPGSNKDTQHCVVDIAQSGLTYTCGDSLGIYADNDPQDIQDLLQAAGLSGEESVSLARETVSLSLRQALVNKLDIGTPGPAFLRLLWQQSQDERDTYAIQKLLEGPPEESKALLAKNSYASLLKTYPSVRMDAAMLVSGLRRLQPRLYSIASSPTQSPDSVELTVGVVRYEVEGQKRTGVASTYLCERCVMESRTLPVFIAPSHFGLPQEDSAPIIMVGPGTGVAPFRSFLKERQARRASGLNWLFFGEQHREHDFLYGEELTALHDEGFLTRLDLAFSRDQDHKVYVQDRMREQGAQLWEWIHNKQAYFYVCGDSKRMAPDVQAALLEVFMKYGNLSEEAAQAYLKELKKQKRYQRDVY